MRVYLFKCFQMRIDGFFGVSACVFDGLLCFPVCARSIRIWLMMMAATIAEPSWWWYEIEELSICGRSSRLRDFRYVYSGRARRGEHTHYLVQSSTEFICPMAESLSAHTHVFGPLRFVACGFLGGFVLESFVFLVSSKGLSCVHISYVDACCVCMGIRSQCFGLGTVC